MHDAANYGAGVGYLGNTAQLAPAINRPAGGHLSFTRSDGYVTKNINRPLSTEGARLVEEALQAALVGEDERYAAEAEASKQAAYDAQRRALLQAQALGMQNMNRQDDFQ